MMVYTCAFIYIYISLFIRQYFSMAVAGVLNVGDQLKEENFCT